MAVGIFLDSQLSNSRPMDLIILDNESGRQYLFRSLFRDGKAAVAVPRFPGISR